MKLLGLLSVSEIAYIVGADDSVRPCNLYKIMLR